MDSSRSADPGYPEAVRWSDDGAAVDLLDQTRLPEAEVRLRLESAAAVAEAIRALRVRGAPAIGIAAAMGLAVEAAKLARGPAAEFRAALEEAHALLAATRPTAVNLFWALDRLRRRASALESAAPEEVARALRDEAPVRVLTHCNAGALATGGMGTALAPIYTAHAAGRDVRVYAGETRPLLQGSRITAWELDRAGIDVTVVADTVVGSLFANRRVDLVIVGADRIAANGDVANKIGTYTLAVLARHHGIPFYVAAPTSTIDLATPTGAAIPIEERDPDEVRRGFGRQTAPASVRVHSPAFDVTPASLVTAIITDRGVLGPPFAESLLAAVGAVAST
jgi:methylthioribose-1-phosphate isomerase